MNTHERDEHDSVNTFSLNTVAPRTVRIDNVGISPLRSRPAQESRMTREQRRYAHNAARIIGVGAFSIALLAAAFSHKKDSTPTGPRQPGDPTTIVDRTITSVATDVKFDMPVGSSIYTYDVAQADCPGLDPREVSTDLSHQINKSGEDNTILSGRTLTLPAGCLEIPKLGTVVPVQVQG